MNSAKQYIAGIYLAAGKSSRMGSDKLTLPLGNLPLGSSAIASAVRSSLDRIFVVTKKEGSLGWIAPFLFANEKWIRIHCPDASRGQAHSIIMGVLAAMQWNADAVLILLADQPLVTAEIIDDLIACYKDQLEQGRNLDYVAASYQGIPRPPVLFSKQMYPVLLSLAGDTGARKLLQDTSIFQGVKMEFDDPDVFYDVDTYKEYLELRERLFPT